MKRTENVELNLNIEFGRLVLFTIFTNRKSSGITCSIPHSGRWDINYPIASTYPVPVGKICISRLVFYPVPALIKSP